MNLELEQTRILAEALAENLKGADQGAAEYDRKQEALLREQQKEPVIPQVNFVLGLYRAFEKENLDLIRTCAGSIPIYKRISESMPALKDLANELIAHTQTLLEIYMRQAEYDRERLAELTAISR